MKNSDAGFAAENYVGRNRFLPRDCTPKKKGGELCQAVWLTPVDFPACKWPERVECRELPVSALASVKETGSWDRWARRGMAMISYIMMGLGAHVPCIEPEYGEESKAAALDL